ncbi:MAG: hypothetical protein JO316_15615 [Abitibacteriaceae bacterium]|nr:hypothetical protein [Abditibacteriaceae bacterium]
MAELIELRAPGGKLAGKFDQEKEVIIIKTQGQEIAFNLSDLLPKNLHRRVVYGKLKDSSN